MSYIQTKIKQLFDSKVPLKIPENGQKLIVDLLPWVNGVLGILGLLSAWWLWRAATRVQDVFNTASDSGLYSGSLDISLGFVFWASVVLLVVASTLMLASVPGLYDRNLTKGWNLAFWAILVNCSYGVLYVFSGIDGAFGQFIWSLVTTILGLFVLFQIVDHYKDK